MSNKENREKEYYQIKLEQMAAHFEGFVENHEELDMLEYCSDKTLETVRDACNKFLNMRVKKI